MLSPADRARVEGAIRDAERGTAGEIVVVVARHASLYRALPAVYALLASLLVPWPLIMGTNLAVGAIALAEAGVALAVAAACWPVPVRFRLAPPGLRRLRAREAAEREFRSHGMTDTRGRTGILLFLAEAERHAEVIGDVAISREVPADAWRSVIEALVGALARGQAADGLVGAVEEIGRILARHAPARDDDADELPNRLVLL